jgi:hypothetical protein
MEYSVKFEENDKMKRKRVEWKMKKWNLTLGEEDHDEDRYG